MVTKEHSFGLAEYLIIAKSGFKHSHCKILVCFVREAVNLNILSVLNSCSPPWLQLKTLF